LYDEQKERIYFKLTNPPAGFYAQIPAADGLARICGISSDITISNQNTYVGSPTSLQGVSQIYIESLFVANRACLDVLENGLSIPLVNIVPCGLVPEGYDINYICMNPDAWMIQYNVENTGLATLRTIDVRICDTFGNVLSLPANQNVDLVFKVYK